MNIIKLLLISLLSFSAYSAEIYIGTGYLSMADDNKGSVYSITLKEGDYKIDLSKWSDYNRTPWFPWHPTWGQYKVESHYVLSLTKEIYDLTITDNLSFFVDIGFAYTDKLSRTSSTHILFRENLGFKYKDFNLYWRHTSNAGIKSPNTGEDAIMLEIRINF